MFFKSKKAPAKKPVKSQPKKRPATGASPRARKAQAVASTGMIRRIFKSAVLISVLGGVGFALHSIDVVEKWNNFYQKPITEVQIDGKFLYLTHASVQAQVNETLAGNFLDLDLVELKKHLETDPWVDYVTVARKWPGKLIIQVTEQQPIARWGQSGFLNMRGDIIRVNNNKKLEVLPLLSGDDRYAQDVMQQYLRMGKLLAQSEMSLASVELDNTLAWTFTTDSGLRVQLGRDQIWEKLQYLIAAKRTALAKKFDQVASVDLRYHNGLAVTWKDALPAPAMAQQNF